MLDFLKILTLNIDTINKVFNNSLLSDFSVYQKVNKNFRKNPNEFNQATFIKEYKGIYFCFYVRKIDYDEVFTKLEILFKPHYYFNDNLHNANDFSVQDCINVLNEFRNLFKLPANEMKIINIEYGINAVSPICCKDLINYIYFHEKNQFYNFRDLKFAKISYKPKDNGIANTYKQIKFYAKGLQFPEYANIDTFRNEVKSKRTNYIKNLGIKTYADLLELKTYKILAENLIKEFDKILIIDAENTMQNLNNKEINILKGYLNPITWNRYLNGSKNLFNRHKLKYFKLLDKTENNIHIILKTIIELKLNELLKVCANLTPSIVEK